MHRRTRWRAAALGAALGLVLFGVGSAAHPQSASAHAYVIDEAPSNGTTVDAPPAAVVVTFDEAVTLPGTPDEASVIDSGGSRVDAGRPTLDAARTTLRVPLRAGLAKGVYLASWSVVSADTHPVGGALQFGYGVPASPSAATAAPEPSPALNLLVGFAKGLLYLALVAAFGVLPAALLLGADAAERRGARRIALIGLGAAAAASALQLVLQYLWDASGTPSGAADGTGAALAAFARSSFALAVAVRVAALAAAAALLARPIHPGRLGRARRLAFAAVGVVAAGSVVVNGHGGAGEWWLFLATFLHATAAVAWIGGLVVLGWLLLRRRMTAERLLRMPHWSLYAGTATVLLALSGTIQGLVEVRFPAALVTTSYGVLLLAKIGFVLVALALAASGHLWVRGQLRAAAAVPAGAAAEASASKPEPPHEPQPESPRPAPGRTARLRARVRWEAAVTALVVVVSGVLSSITPAEAAWAPAQTKRLEVGPYRVTVEVEPTRRGPETFRVTVVPPEPNASLPQSVELTLAQRGGPVRGLEVPLPYRVASANHPDRPTAVTFTSASVDVPDAGEWTATFTVVLGPLEQYTAAVDYRAY